MKFGNLEFAPVNENMPLVSKPTATVVKQQGVTDAMVATIDPALSDTAAFCEHYGIGPEVSINCVIVQAKRGDTVKYAAVMIPATKRADINGMVRKALNARKISFAPMEDAVSLTGMEFGAINPIGLPNDWEILVDTEATKLDHAIIGSGIRASKLLIPGNVLASLPNATVLDLAKN